MHLTPVRVHKQPYERLSPTDAAPTTAQERVNVYNMLLATPRAAIVRMALLPIIVDDGDGSENDGDSDSKGSVGDKNEDEEEDDYDEDDPDLNLEEEELAAVVSGVEPSAPQRLMSGTLPPRRLDSQPMGGGLSSGDSVALLESSGSVAREVVENEAGHGSRRGGQVGQEREAVTLVGIPLVNGDGRPDSPLTRTPEAPPGGAGLTRGAAAPTRGALLPPFAHDPALSGRKWMVGISKVAPADLAYSDQQQQSRPQAGQPRQRTRSPLRVAA